MVKMRFISIFIVVLLLAPCIQAELGLTIVGGFNWANVFHEESEMQKWSGDLNAPAFGIERINVQSYYPLKFGKFTILAGINVGAPLSAIESYSSGGTNKVAVEELNIDYGALMGVSYGINDKYGVRLFLHYGFAELWIEPQAGQRLTTIIGGACIYYNL